MTGSSQPLVSIVTPVFNEEEHLAECIQSVLAQTYCEWDYTIVNNCSTDASLDIARCYAARDSRIRIHDNDRFLEMLPNHNLAVRQISPGSKYCKVVLADDVIFPECVEKMVSLAEAHPSLGIVSSYRLYGEEVHSTGLPYWVTVAGGREVCRQSFLRGLSLFGTQTSVLYRADLVRRRDPFYHEWDIHADTEVCFALLGEADLGFVHQVLTFTRPRPGSTDVICSDIGTRNRSRLDLLTTYGRKWLSEAEYAQCLDRELSQYYRFLGRRWFVERDRGFWAYHSKAFADAGITFSRTRLARAAVSGVCSSVLDLRGTLDSIGRLARLREMRNADRRRSVLQTAREPRRLTPAAAGVAHNPEILDLPPSGGNRPPR